jgi:hypothetical protein
MHVPEMELLRALPLNSQSSALSMPAARMRSEDLPLLLELMPVFSGRPIAGALLKQVRHLR